MLNLNRTNFPGKRYTTRVLQFGEGNFLRAFVDWQLDILNEKTDLDAGIVIVRPINTTFPPSLNTQDGLYTTIIRGIDEQNQVVNTDRMIRSVNKELNIYTDYPEVMKLAQDVNLKFIFSNTTEAGICYDEKNKITDAPPSTYPAKLTQFLHARFQFFKGSKESGLFVLPCELIDYNGETLKKIVLKYANDWDLSSLFVQWLNDSVEFCSTLVDRIVPGYPKEEVEGLQASLEYTDQFMDTAEYFYLFVIQGSQALHQALRLDQVEMNIKIVDDIKPYKERKVAILNGAHTGLVPVAYLAGLDTVGESMNDPQILTYVEKTIFDEIIPTLSLPTEELTTFANDVIKRFKNPYIKHQLLSISLNGMTKFKTRILPQLLTYVEKNQKLPTHLVFSLAALIAFYRGERNGVAYPLNDDQHWLDCFKQLWADFASNQISLQELVATVLSQKSHWEIDLTTVPNLTETSAYYLSIILKEGMRSAINRCVDDLNIANK